MQYDTLHQAWRGECGGKDAASAYCRYVTEGLAGAAENPLTSALGEWVIGSRDFLNRMVALAAGGDQADQVRVRLTRRMSAMSVDEVIRAVAQLHRVEPEEYVGFRSMASGREMAALLCRRYTSVTLAQLSDCFGLRHPDSSANLVRRAQRRAEQSASYRRQIALAESQLTMKTENQV